MRAAAIVFGIIALACSVAAFILESLRHSYAALTLGVVVGMLAAACAVLDWMERRGYLGDTPPAPSNVEHQAAVERDDRPTAPQQPVRAGASPRPARTDPQHRRQT